MEDSVERGFPQHLVRAIENLHVDNESTVGIANLKYKIAEIRCSERHGCPLSLTLINIYIGEVVHEWKVNTNNCFKINDIIVDT